MLILQQSTVIDGALRPAGMYFDIPVEDLQKAIRLVTAPPKKGRGRPKKVADKMEAAA
jgi:hypothetical protein